MASRDPYVRASLNDIELDALAVLADNPTAQIALKKLFLATINSDGVSMEGLDIDPTINSAFALVSQHGTLVSDEMIAKDLRTKWEASKLIKAGFDALTSYKTPAKSAVIPKRHR